MDEETGAREAAEARVVVTSAGQQVVLTFKRWQISSHNVHINELVPINTAGRHADGGLAFVNPSPKHLRTHPMG